MAGTPAATIPNVPLDAPSGGRVVPFRNATLERSELNVQLTGTITAAQQPLEYPIEGNGFIFGIVLDVAVVTAGNGAAVAYQEDGAWSSLALVALSDSGAQAISVTGFQLFLCNLSHRLYTGRFWDQSSLNTLVTGAGATGGSFTFLLRVPLGINRRTLIGILGNQDRSIKYSLRTDVAPSSFIYSTPPTNAGAYTIQKLYENYSVPSPTGPGGTQEVIPATYGSLSFLTATRSENPPSGGSTVNHYIRRTGNTVRYYILVFRLNGSRANAETNAPSRIHLKVGDTDVFNETYRYRRALMFERYGFDFPSGVLVYDTIHDFTAGAGYELGDDWWSTQAVANGQFQVTYPAGFGNTNNSLEFITNDMSLTGQTLAA